MKSHIDSLKQKHSELEKRIKSANDNHAQDYNITELKKQKLLLKEKIIKLEERSQGDQSWKSIVTTILSKKFS